MGNRFLKLTVLIFGIFFVCNAVVASEIALTVGVYDDPPLAFFDKEARAQGLFVDVLREIAKREKWSLKFEPCIWKGCLSRLSVGSLDILGPVAFSKDRAKLYKFNRESVFINWGELYRRSDVSITSFQDIKNRKVSLVERDIYARAFNELTLKLNLNIQPVFADDYGGVFQNLLKGKADFGVVSRLFGMMHAGDYGVVVTSVIFKPVELKYAARKDLDDHILHTIDEYVREFKKNRKSIYYRSVDKWISGKGAHFLPRWAIVVFVVCGVALAAFLVVTVLLNRMVKKRTESLTLEISRNEEIRSKLREAVNLYRTLFQFLPCPVLTLDEYGKIIDCNNNAISFFNLPMEKIKGAELWDLFEDDGRESLKESMEHAINCALMGFTHVWRMRDLEVNGCHFVVDAAFKSIFTEKGVNVLCTLHDITERIQIEEHYRAQWELLRRVIDGMPIATTVIDYQGNVVVWNKATEVLTYIPRDNVLNRPLDLSPLFGGRDLPVPALLLLKKSPEEIEREFHGRIRVYPYHEESVEAFGIILVKDGERKDVHVVASKLRDEAGNIIGVVQCGRDITEERKLRESIIQAQKMEAIGRLAGGFAHDLNNVLTFIMGCCDMLLLAVDDNREAIDYIGRIRMAIKRAGKLSEQLLGFSRKQFYLPRYINVNDVVKSVVEDMRSFLGEDIELELELADEVLTTKVDPLQLEQGLTNLMINAKDAMPQGGTLKIFTERVKLDNTLRVGHFEVPAGNYVTISVKDSGEGIRSEVLKHIFEPYFSTKPSGSGLGLTVVYGVVKQSGGSIVVESKPGEGTVFTLYLPYVAVPDYRNGTDNGKDRVGIFIIDDDEQLLTLLEQTLASVGFDVICARSGREALGKLEKMKDKVEIIFSDVMLPDIDCDEYVRKLRSVGEGCVIIFTSGYSVEYLEEQGVKLEQMENFIQKPFTPADLIVKIKKLTD